MPPIAPPQPHHQRPSHPPLPQGPISPPLNSLPYHQPPRKKRPKTLIIAVIVGSVFAVVIGLVLHYFNISINVILTALAPIWVGGITLTYSVIAKD